MIESRGTSVAWRGKTRVVISFLVLLALVALVVVSTIKAADSFMAHKRQQKRDAFVLDVEIPPQKERVMVAGPDKKEVGIRIRCRVVNEMGDAIAGAEVALMDTHSLGESRVNMEKNGTLARTGDRGHCDLISPRSWFRPEKSLVLVARHRLYQPEVQPLESAPTGPLAIVMKRGATIAGRAVFVDGVTPAGNLLLVARGVGAPVQVANEARVPGPAAQAQYATTSASGNYRFEGLSQGHYQIDAATPGLALVWNATRQGQRWRVGTRGVIARTGESSVDLVVGAFAVVRAQIVDAANGWPIVTARVRFQPGAGLEAVKMDVLPYSKALLSAGDVVSLAPRDQPQGVHAHFLMSRKFPVPEDAAALAVASAPGFRSASTDVPVRSVGAVGPLPVIRLEPAAGRGIGAVRLRLADWAGAPIGGVSVHLEFGKTDEPEPCFGYVIRFDDRGRTVPLALPSGAYRIRLSEPPERTSLAPANVEIRPGEVTDAVLRLQEACGIDIKVGDEQGRTLGDFALRIGRGHKKVHLRLSNNRQGGTSLSGFFLLRPGMGAVWPGRRIGFKPGPYTVEVYRHGHRPFRAFVECVAGRMTRVVATLPAAPTEPWDTWMRAFEDER